MALFKVNIPLSVVDYDENLMWQYRRIGRITMEQSVVFGLCLRKVTSRTRLPGGAELFGWLSFIPKNKKTDGIGQTNFKDNDVMWLVEKTLILPEHTRCTDASAGTVRCVFGFVCDVIPSNVIV